MKKKLTTTAIFSLLPMLVFCHGSHGSGVMAGFTHPIFGWDHNLAIVGLGVLSYAKLDKKWFLYGLTFLIPMIIGGVLGIGNEATVFFEKVIALSVGIIGAYIISSLGKYNILVIASIAVFGFFHGYAHGAEMPESTTALQYVSGFSIGVILLFSLSYFISNFILKNKADSKYLTIAGGFLIGASFVFLVS